MATPQWNSATLYPPGSLVVPRTAPAPSAPSITNGDFQSGATGWDLTGAVAVVSDGHGFPAQPCLRLPGNQPFGLAMNQSQIKMQPGDTLSVSCMIEQGPSIAGATWGYAVIRFYDLNGAQVGGDVAGNTVDSGSNGAWHKSTTPLATAPAGTAYARAGIFLGSVADHSHPIWGDHLAIESSSVSTLTNLQYKAVQPAVGFSASTEPVWPTTLGTQVIDNEVIWEAVLMSRLVYEARPIMVSGATEPAWPSNPGESVVDNTIQWTAINPTTTDPNCPQSKVVAIIKYKVYAGDKDKVRYTATLAPQDWTTEKNAGYLGTGVQQNGANEVSLLGLYRANLIVMNASTMQQWQVDPDPEMMDLLDTMEGIGSRYHLAAVPVANDMLYLSNKGVRSLGLSGANNNLKSGDVGLPVDEMIMERVRECVARGEEPLGAYLPSMGQYWLMVNREAWGDSGSPGSPIDLCPTLSYGDAYGDVMVYTMTQVGSVGAWSRYVFPFPIDDWTQDGDFIYLRSGGTIHKVDETIGACDFYADGEGETGSPFNAIIQWPWLDFGAPGRDKQMESFDIVGNGESWIEFGTYQTEPGWFTTPYRLPPDTLPGTVIPMPITAPSYSIRLRYNGWDPLDWDTYRQRHWSFIALNLTFV